MDDQVKLTVEIKNQKPIELVDLAKSMLGIGAEYRAFIARDLPELEASQVSLYVKEVRTGSVITELAALAPFALPIIEQADSVIMYGQYLAKCFKWLLGDGGRPQEFVEKSTLQNLNDIVEPVAKDHASQINLQGTTVNGDLNLVVNMNSTEANAIQNAIRKELQASKETVTGTHYNVVMYWAQARNQADSRSGDRARIESIYKGHVKTVFANDSLKAKMLYEPAHPFKKAFVVDVAVETVGGKPVLYNVLCLHDTIDIDEAAPTN
jgi:hypothetical protein